MIARCSKGTMPHWAASLPGGQAHLYHRQRSAYLPASHSSKRQTSSSYKSLHSSQIGPSSSDFITSDFILFVRGSFFWLSVQRSFIHFSSSYTSPDSFLAFLSRHPRCRTFTHICYRCMPASSFFHLARLQPS